MNVNQLLVEAREKGGVITSHAKHGAYETVFMQGNIATVVKTMEA